METGINRKGNVEETIREDTLWQDPMSYPVYDRESLLERSATVRKESKNKSFEAATSKVAA